MLLTDFAANAKGGGAVILRSLINPEDLIWVGLSEVPAEDKSSIDYRLVKRDKFQSKSRSIVLDSLFAHSLAVQVIAIARRERVEVIWVVMHGAVVHIAAILARSNEFKVHVTVHDDPIAYTLISRKRFWLAPLIAKDFAYTLKKANSVDVIGKNMSAYYRDKYDVGSKVVHRALEPIDRTEIYDREQNCLSIGILGSNYSYDQLPLLCRAMVRVGNIIGKKSRLVIIGDGHGTKLKSEFAADVEIEITGHLDEEKGVNILKSCLVLYLNYPFTNNFKVFRHTSFPTKLSSYIQAVRPILIHAPKDSSITELTSRGMDTYIYSWQSLAIEDGVKALIDCWNNRDKLNDWGNCAEKVRQTYFDTSVNRRLMHELIYDL